jgi:hypothetical protein
MRKIAMTLLILGLIAVAFTLPRQTQAGGIGTQVSTWGAEPSDLQKTFRTLDGRFVEGDNGIIIDTETRLEWLVGPDKDTTWDEANSWVKRLSVDGDGWRMPKRDELKTLYAHANEEPNLSGLFYNLGWFVWTSETESILVNSYAWGFSFIIGDEFRPPCIRSNIARGFAVRSAKCQLIDTGESHPALLFFSGIWAEPGM